MACRVSRSLSFLLFAIIVAVVYPAMLSGAGKRTYHTRRVEGSLPVIDGRLDDEAWRSVPWSGQFLQKSPYEGAPPSQKTAFKILYDHRNLYVALRAYDTEPGKITRHMTRRDEHDGDWVEIILDSYFDHRTGFLFNVSAAGVKTDAVVSEDGENFDNSWDPIWYAGTAIDEKGWTAEMLIPLAQLRFGKKKEHTWGLHVARYLYRKQEFYEWHLIPQNAKGWVSLFGRLKGLKGIHSKRPIELMPYAVADLQHFEKEENNPFADGKSTALDIGLDGKVGISNDLTLDFTMNPDFGQVEADPSEVNLTAFETFFQEKRPFFIEGRNILDYLVTGGSGPYAFDNLFYSRRIGRRPHHTPDIPAGEHLDMPGATAILAAFKLTGKTRKGLSIGILESLTGEETARIDSQGGQREETVEPLTNYLVLRLHKDFSKGNTGIGGIFTAVNRDLNSPAQLNYLHRAAYTAGFDFFHYWKNKEWMVSLKSVYSHVQGSPEALLETQLSSRRYFQRPDAGYVTLKPHRTTLSGYGGDFLVGKVGGALNVIAGAVWRSPGLELNDIGFLRSADKFMPWAVANYRITKPFSIFRRFYAGIDMYNQWNFGGETDLSGATISTDMEFKNYWSFSGIYEFLREALSHDALRGGPSLLVPPGWNYNATLRSDSRRKIYFWLGGGQFKHRHQHAYYSRLWSGVTIKPSNALSVSIAPTFTINKQNLQYVDTITLDASDSGNRYVFARIDQKILDITLRLNYSITPDLSVQFYGQPFISTGKYSQFKHITQPRAEVYEDRFHVYNGDEIVYAPEEQNYYINEAGGASYQFENPDFKSLQFRSNLVVRWEYTPGSTLFLVWSQGRTDTLTHDIGFSPRRALRDLFRVHPHDVFLLKFTYRFKF
jgi:hypothetical protein